MDKVVQNCPWCGGHLVWSEWTLVPGTKIKATCCYGMYVTRINISINNPYTCDFECTGIRLKDGVVFMCSEELYWKNRFKEAQLEFDF